MSHNSTKAYSEKLFVYFIPSHFLGNAIEYTSNFLKYVMTPNLFKWRSFYSLVLCSQFAGYHLVHVEPVDTTLLNFLTKIPFGENADGENSVQRKFCSAKIPFGKNPSAKIFSAKTPRAIIIYIKGIPRQM